ncbi:MAG: hypothetical protein IJX88_02735 [Clostridia bacterium]|nr:hypothetical protein [Clostridia bacterium]
MAKQYDFSDLSAEELEAEKRKNWERMKAELGIDEEPTPPIRPKVRISLRAKRQLIAVCASAVLLIGVGITGGIHIGNYLEAKNKPPQEEIRYCASSEYTPQETDVTLKEYSLQSGEKIRYFDWYDILDDLQSESYHLNTTQEIIAYREILLNGETGYYVELYVMNKLTEIETVSSYKIACSENTMLNNIAIKYRYQRTGSNAMWEYEGYCYYLEAKNIGSAEDLFALVEELL